MVIMVASQGRYFGWLILPQLRRGVIMDEPAEREFFSLLGDYYESLTLCRHGGYDTILGHCNGAIGQIHSCLGN